jgi:hypothetical protein
VVVLPENCSARYRILKQKKRATRVARDGSFNSV